MEKYIEKNATSTDKFNCFNDRCVGYVDCFLDDWEILYFVYFNISNKFHKCYGLFFN